MKIVLVGPGFMPIPSTGWGAVENLIWDIRCELLKLGHEVHIINTPNRNEIVFIANQLNPDFIHVQYDDYADCAPYFNCKNVAVTNHYAYLTQVSRWGPEYHRIFNSAGRSTAKIFALSEKIAKVYIDAGTDPSRVKVVPNGVNVQAFRFLENPESRKSAYLAKIEPRKRQYLTTNLEQVYYYGRIAPGYESFSTHKNYCGEWSRSQLHEQLTNHANLVLLSDGEAHPLVCMEALAAGLGLVISEHCTANLDTSKEFITVIPESKIQDLELLRTSIQENAEISLGMRESIRSYALTFDWEKQVSKNYINHINPGV